MQWGLFQTHVNFYEARRTAMKIKLVKDKYEALLMKNPNVVAVGTYTDANREVIKIFVKKKAKVQHLGAQEHNIPAELEGFVTDVEEIGEVSALAHPAGEELKIS